MTEPAQNRLRLIFFGPSGLRAGWRLLAFALMVWLLFAARSAFARAFMSHVGREVSYMFRQTTRFVICLIASWVMARFERRSIAHYGLPWRRAFGTRFWQGTAMGIGTLTLLLLAMRAAHVFDFGPIRPDGIGALKYGALYGVVFLIIGLSEEYYYRGYPLVTLATGIGFWPAAIGICAYFGYTHHGTPGETWLGLVNAGLGGLLFALLLRKTGDLWMAIGFHSAFDWGQSFLYGVPDSGHVLPGSLLVSRLSGPGWLSGGTVGPEGSVLCTLVIIAVGSVIAAWPRRVPDTHGRGSPSSDGETFETRRSPDP